MIGDIGIQAMANSISLGQLPFLKNLKMKEVSLLPAQKKIYYGELFIIYQTCFIIFITYLFENIMIYNFFSKWVINFIDVYRAINKTNII